MQGSFDITCAPRPDGTTAINRQAISAPWHLSKPYWTGQVLLVQAVNATAGIFAGDQLDFCVNLEPDAAVLLTSPSASRIHTMPSGEANLRQKISVKAGAWLEWMPELFIPQRDCRYRQQTELHVERGASVYFVETLAPGRVAYGEMFAFERLHWSTRIHYDGKLVLAEHYPMSPRDQSLRDLKRDESPWYFASALLIHSGAIPLRTWQTAIADWSDTRMRSGATQLASDVYLFRLLARDSETLKHTLSGMRSLLGTHLANLRESARKL